MLKLEEIIQNIDTTKISTQKDDNYLFFSVNIKTEENNNDEIIDDDEINNNEEKQDSNNINYNNFIYENENNENEYLNIKIELLKYSKITTDYKEKYYLMFNYIDGEIYDYYNYLKIIKIYTSRKFITSNIWRNTLQMVCNDSLLLMHICKWFSMGYFFSNCF